jgi:hypothetical protein
MNFLAEGFIDGRRLDMPVDMECDRDAVQLFYAGSQAGDYGRSRLAQTIVI